jgi:hypothetical protein
VFPHERIRTEIPEIFIISWAVPVQVGLDHRNRAVWLTGYWGCSVRKLTVIHGSLAEDEGSTTRRACASVRPKQATRPGTGAIPRIWQIEGKHGSPAQNSGGSHDRVFRHGSCNSALRRDAVVRAPACAMPPSGASPPFCGMGQYRGLSVALLAPYQGCSWDQRLSRSWAITRGQLVRSNTIRLCPLASLLLLVGCHTVSEVQPTGRNNYMVTATTGSLNEDAHIAAVREANKYCSQRGLAATVTETSTGGGPRGWMPVTVTVQFACSDAEHQQPAVLRPDRGISTNN